MGGYPLPHAMMLMIPEAWAGNPLMDEDRRAFYEYHAALMEPWDGPAAMAFTDGRQIGATLDRNGLRPARFVVTDDDFIVMASEVGVLDIPEQKIVKKWRLQPGKMLLVDLEQGRIVDDDELKRDARDREALPRLDGAAAACGSRTCPSPRRRSASDVALLDRQQAFGYTQEDLKILLTPMVAERRGSDRLDGRRRRRCRCCRTGPRSLYNYFKQLFAQVTNPPIDPIREELVMSLVSFIGPRPNLLGVDVDRAADAPRGRSSRSSRPRTWRSCATSSSSPAARSSSIELDICYPAEWGANGMEAGAGEPRARTPRTRCTRATTSSSCPTARSRPDRLPIPALLATAAVHEHLVRAGPAHVRRARRRDRHARARCTTSRCSRATAPRRSIRTSRSRRSPSCTRRCPRSTPKESQKRFIKAICKGLLQGDVEDGHLHLPVVLRRADLRGGRPAEDVRRQVLHRHGEQRRGHRPVRGRRGSRAPARARVRRRPAAREQLDAGGEYAYRVRGEAHMWTPDSIAKLQHAARVEQRTRPISEYAALINEQSAQAQDAARPVRIQRRRASPRAARRSRAREGRSSSASPPARCASARSRTEAHTTLAIAMNRIGGKSNTGEGGEDPLRYRAEMRAGHEHGEGWRHARVDARRDRASRPTSSSDGGRQPALEDQAGGRRGASASPPNTSRPPTSCRSRWRRARSPAKAASCRATRSPSTSRKLRYSVPGVGLISPPPHHDIYSIEDLAQLIHDLKNANPQRVDLGEARLARSASARSPRASRRPRPITSPSRGTTAARARRRCRRSSTPARRGSSGSPRRSRRSCSTACAAASPCRSTAR